MEVLTEIEQGVFQVKVPVPFPLRNVQCYLVREVDGWTMIDTGLQDPAALKAWDHAFRTLKMTPREIRRILLTHSHPDHYGLAGHFQRLADTPVYALDKEIEIIPREWPEREDHFLTLMSFYGRYGAPDHVLSRVRARSLEVLKMVQPQPILSPLSEGQELQIGGRRFRVAWLPGHSDGHMILMRLDDGLAFTGDHVLVKITPNIALWPLLDPNPLRRYLESLDKISRLPISIALPGHRALIHDVAARAEEIKAHHHARLEACREAAGDGCSGYEVCRVIFPHLHSTDDIRMGMVETLSHLEYLVSEGQLERLEGDVVRYRQPASPTP